MIVDVTTYIEVFQRINETEVIDTNVLVTTCLKEEVSAEVLGCESYTPLNGPVPVAGCEEQTDITHPQEMNKVNKGSNALTVKSQKEVFLCDFNGMTVLKKVDIVLFTSIYENLATQTMIDEPQFHQMRCLTLVFDSDPLRDNRRDGTVESCIFSEVIT